jgi:hypothetical protein
MDNDEIYKTCVCPYKQLDNNNDNELHHIYNKNKKIKNKNKGGIMSFKFVTPFAKTRKQRGQRQARRQTHLK